MMDEGVTSPTEGTPGNVQSIYRKRMIKTADAHDPATGNTKAVCVYICRPSCVNASPCIYITICAFPLHSLNRGTCKYEFESSGLLVRASAYVFAASPPSNLPASGCV